MRGFFAALRMTISALRMTIFGGGFGGSDPTHDGGTVMNGAPGSGVAEVAGGAAAGGDEELGALVGHDFFLGNLVFCCSDCG